MGRLILATICIVLLVSCDDSIVKSGYKTTDNGSWNKENSIDFTFSELDTVQAYDVFIQVRNDNNFPFSNLFLITELSGPEGNSIKDTLEYKMAAPDGMWLGKGYGSVKENKLWYKENIVFPTSGVYTLKVSHAMRKNGNVDGVVNLEGITDVGFEIVKRNK